MTCQDVQQQIRHHFDTGTLPAMDEAVQRHLRHCAQCREVYENLARLEANLHALQPAVPPEIRRAIFLPSGVSASTRWQPALAAIALAVVLLVGLVAYWFAMPRVSLPEKPPATFALDGVEAPQSPGTVMIFQKEQGARKYHIVWIQNPERPL